MYPGLAVAEALRQIEPAGQILFLCTERQIDKDILQGNSYRYEIQPIVPLPRKLNQVGEFYRRWRASVRMAERLMQAQKPAAVLGLGGYASGPAMKVAAKMKIPVAMLNPDMLPGKANKFCQKYAQKIFVQFEESKKYFGANERKCLVSGCPIRKGFAAGAIKNKAKIDLTIDCDRRVLVVMGGSQGGHNINAAVVKCFIEDREGLLKDWQIVHITGKDDKDGVADQYKAVDIKAIVWDFTTRMPEVLSGADLVIGRSGASSLAELTAVGLPSILLPYPYHRDRHQRRNAEVLEKTGAARIVADDCNPDSTAARLKEALRECMNEQTLTRMSLAAESIGKPDAALIVAEELRKLATRDLNATILLSAQEIKG